MTKMCYLRCACASLSGVEVPDSLVVCMTVVPRLILIPDVVI